MANFLRDWLRNQRKEHKDIVGQTSPSSGGQRSATSDLSPDSSVPSSSSATTPSFAAPEQVVFQNEEFKLFVKKISFKRQKNFKVQDLQFWLRIIPLQDHENPPLFEILDFLEEGFNFILLQLKSFFKPEEHRIAYLTLYQEPMVIF